MGVGSFVVAQSPLPLPLPSILILAAAIAAGGLLYVDLPFSRASNARISLGDAALAAGLLLTTPAGVLIASVVGTAAMLTVEAVRERQPFVKPLFNLGQHVLAVGLATLAGQALIPVSREIGPETIAGVAAAMLVFTVTNVLVVSGMISLTSDGTLIRTVRRLAVPVLVLPAQGLALGVLAVVVWRSEPFALPALAVPVLLLHTASRQRVRAQLERERSERFVEIEQALGQTASLDQLGELVQSAAERLLGVRAAVWQDEHWIGPVPPGSQPCRVGSDLAVALVTRGESIGPTVEGPCAAIGLGHGVLVIWTGLPELADDTVEWLGRLGQSGRVHAARAVAAVALEQERATLRAVVDGTADGICVTDGAGIVRVWNPAMANLSGFEAAAAMGCRIRDVLGPGPWESDGIHDLARPAEVRVWRVAIASISDIAHDRLRVAVVHDVSEERRLARMKDDMLAVVSHELRTPLTPIKGSAQLLLRRWDKLSTDDRERLLGQIESRADHLARLVNDLILVGQLSAEGAQPLEVEVVPTDLAQLLSDAAAQLRLNYPDRELAVTAPDRVYGVTDPLRVRQIVDNLADNACKFSPPGAPIHIALLVEGDRFRITVTDHGRGIAAGDLDRVFERFERVEDPLLMETSGAGLGLYIVRQLVDLLHGSVSLDSHPSTGTTVTVTLPYSDAATLSSKIAFG